MGRESRQRAEAKRLRKEAAKAAAVAKVAETSSSQGFRSPGRELRWAILKALPLGVLLPIIIFFGSVGPDDFSKNYASWARTLGLTDWAEWLALYATGPRVLGGAVVISLVYLAIAFVIPFLIKHAKRDTAVVAVPISVALIVVIAAYGQYAISLPSERHVSEYQRTKLKEILSPVISNFPAL